MKKDRRADTTVAISGKRREELSDAVVDFIIATRQQIKVSEIVHYLIDEYLEEGLKDMIEKEKAHNKEIGR